MRYVKVLDKDLRPPIQRGKQYKIGVWHHCENFDTSDTECAPGFYVIPVSELIHYHKPWDDTKVVPAEVKGCSKIFSASKQRYEYIKLGNPLTDEEVKALCREIEPELGYKLSEALYPVNPLLLPKATVSDEDIELLRKWRNIRKSVCNSIEDSIENSIWDSVWNRVWDSVWDSVCNSVGDSVEDSEDSVLISIWNSIWDSIEDSLEDSIEDSIQDSIYDNILVYVASLFPNIQKWKYTDHKVGVYPFQPAVDLWYRGLIPVFDGGKWMLLSGEKAEVVWQEPEIGWLKAQEE